MELERLYGWEAEDRDGIVHRSEFLESNNRAGFGVIPHGNLAIFRITMLVHSSNGGVALGDPKKFNVLTIHLEEGERVVYRRRVSLATGSGSRTVILAGARKNVKGRDVQRLHWIFEDTGEIHSTDRFREDHEWFYSPVIKEYEVAP